ncbi:hypothetical protein OAP56_02610 [Rickettsiaceae bacterium]|nr:hypothetical protein [Rickettsiaceae bacterium]
MSKTTTHNKKNLSYDTNDNTEHCLDLQKQDSLPEGKSKLEMILHSVKFSPLVESVQLSLKNPINAEFILDHLLKSKDKSISFDKPFKDKLTKLDEEILSKNKVIKDKKEQIQPIDIKEMKVMPDGIKKLFQYLSGVDPLILKKKADKGFIIKEKLDTESIAVLLKALELKKYNSLILEYDHTDLIEVIGLLENFPFISSLTISSFLEEPLNEEFVENFIEGISKTGINNLVMDKRAFSQNDQLILFTEDLLKDTKISFSWLSEAEVLIQEKDDENESFFGDPPLNQSFTVNPTGDYEYNDDYLTDTEQ